MTLPQVDRADWQASGKLIQDAIGEVQHVIVAPLVDALTKSILAAGAALDGIPAIVAESVGHVLTELDGFTVTTTVTMTNTIHRKP